MYTTASVPLLCVMIILTKLFFTTVDYFMENGLSSDVTNSNRKAIQYM